MIAPRECYAFHVNFRRVCSLTLLAIGAFLFLMASTLKATENECSTGETLFGKRAQLIEALNKMGAQPTPQEACSKITSLVQNGAVLLTWMRKEKDWCKIPDDLVERLKADHEQSLKLQKQACDAAKAPIKPKMPALGDSNPLTHQPDDKNQLTSPIPVPQEIPLK